MTTPFTGVVPGPVKVKVEVSSVVGSMASLKTAVAMVLGHAPFAGVAETTAGAPTPEQAPAPVVKVHTIRFASPMPNTSLALVEMAAV